MANDYSMADISTMRARAAADSANWAINSTSRPNNVDLDMTDFLKLMIVQLQSQTLDDSMDTSEMMNQMVQMQMVTAITNMTETNIMTYAGALVGKEVTIGIVNGNKLEERLITVIGTGTYDGQQVIFGSDGETYGLNQIMAVGKLPPKEETEEPGDGTNKPGDVNKPDGGDGASKPGDVDKPSEGDGASKPGDVDNPDGSSGVDKPGGNTGTENNPDKPDGGTEDTVNPSEAVG